HSFPTRRSSDLGPEGVSTSFCSSSWATCASATMRWQRSKYKWPASVSCTRRVVRLSSRRPSDRSSSATWRDTVDLGTPRLAAARPKLQVLATSTKNSMPCKRFMRAIPVVADDELSHKWDDVFAFGRFVSELIQSKMTSFAAQQMSTRHVPVASLYAACRYA